MLRLDRILKACENIEKARAELYLAYRQEAENNPNIDPLPQDEWEADNIGGIVTIYIPDYPPKYNIFNPDLRNRWLKNMAFALQSLDNFPRFDKIFVYIKFFIPGEMWDIDNRNIKLIIDSIRYAGVIKDDSYQHLAYGAEGNNSKPYHTEIYIFDYHNIAEILPIITTKPVL